MGATSFVNVGGAEVGSPAKTTQIATDANPSVPNADLIIEESPLSLKSTIVAYAYAIS